MTCIYYVPDVLKKNSERKLPRERKINDKKIASFYKEKLQVATI